MRPVNIYTLTRIKGQERIKRLERQMSLRSRYLKIKEWETEGLKSLCDNLCRVMEDAPSLDFFYSFTMPKLGKEFDLLRINEDFIVNIELKSGDVPDEAIKKQLEQNKYYLSTLGLNMYFYTYISRSDRLVRLSGGGRLIDTDWEELATVLGRQRDCYTGDIEDLFKEDRYLISPLTDPGRFLRGDYFLTSQQRDIRKQILRDIVGNNGNVLRRFSVHGFTGLPGTGKTILLYDIAMQLSVSRKVCVLHLGSHAKELRQLDERLKRVDFYYLKPDDRIILRDEYDAILVDEGHRLGSLNLADIMVIATNARIPVIISYDREDTISPDERSHDGSELIEKIDGFLGFRLTNRIRLNSELSSFIGLVMCVARGGRRHEYPDVSLVYASDNGEVEHLLRNFEKNGYIYIWDELLADSIPDAPAVTTSDPDNVISDQVDEESMHRIEAKDATCREFDRVVMLIDESFSYDDDGYLRSSVHSEDKNVSAVRDLFHGLSRAKKRVALIIRNNPEVFDRLLSILQRG